MPGSNAGTGQPLTFICAKCRLKRWRIERWYKHRAGRGLDVWDYHVTGRFRYRPTYNRGGGRSDVFYQYEYECVAPGCGHIGWSRHIEVSRQFKREFGGEQLVEHDHKPN